MRKISFILFTILSINTYASEALFNKANTLYMQEQYSNAILLYDSIVSTGLESSELYYNLGNCYYKNSDWANAIWHYEKSLSISIDKRTLENLELTKSQLIDRVEEMPQLFYKKWKENAINLFTIKTWQKLTIICMWIILTIQLLNTFFNYKRKYLSILFNILALILVYMSYISYQEKYKKNIGIIFSNSTEVNSAPTRKSVNLFVLHPGTKVEIIDNINEWINIKIANGKNGWIKESDCKTLK